jgi:hypothetical protein
MYQAAGLIGKIKQKAQEKWQHHKKDTAILLILENRAERERLSGAGRARVLSHHVWPHSMQRLETIIERCLDSFASMRRPRSRSLLRVPRSSTD